MKALKAPSNRMNRVQKVRNKIYIMKWKYCRGPFFREGLFALYLNELFPTLVVSAKMNRGQGLC